MGVSKIPQGIPHQPKMPEMNAPPNFALTPHARQQTLGLLRQDVISRADHTTYEVCTSIGPGPPHLGQVPW